MSGNVSTDEEPSHIAEAYFLIFNALREVSLYRILSRKWCGKLQLFSRNSKTAIESWALGHLLGSFILWALWPIAKNYWWIISAVWVYAIIRIFEALVCQINVLLFDWYRDAREKEIEKKKGRPYVVRGYLRILLLLLQNYAEFVFWFAILYLNWNSAFANEVVVNRIVNYEPLWNPLLALNYSFFVMTTFGLTAIKIVWNIGYAITLVQSVIGLFMTLMIIARFIAYIPKENTSDKIENRFIKESKELR